MKLKEAIERVKQIAMEYVPPGTSDALSDKDAYIELLFPRTLDMMITDWSKHEHLLQGLRKTHTISITTGKGPLPNGVKEKYADSSFIESASKGVHPAFSFIRTWNDYNCADLYYSSAYHFRNGYLYFRSMGTTVNDYDSGTIDLNIITVPSFPSSLTDEWDDETKSHYIPTQLLHQLIIMTAALLVKELNLVANIFENPSIAEKNE